MNTNLMIGLVAVAVILGGGIYWFTSAETPSVDKEVTREESVKGSFASLVESGKSYECTFQYSDEDNTSSGTVYMTAGAERVRGDFEITSSPVGPLSVSMVRDGGYNYLWGSSMPAGMKTVVSNQKMLLDDGATSSVDDSVNYDCRPWAVEDGKFSLPGNVNFQDMTQVQTNTETPATLEGNVEVEIN